MQWCQCLVLKMSRASLSALKLVQIHWCGFECIEPGLTTLKLVCMRRSKSHVQLHTQSRMWCPWLEVKQLHGWLQVVDASDVLFLFSGIRSITDIIASNKGKLQEDQILVAVTKDGGIDEYQASMYSLCGLLACFARCASMEFVYARMSGCF